MKKRYLRFLLYGLVGIVFLNLNISINVAAQEVIEIIENGNQVELPLELYQKLNGSQVNDEFEILTWLNSNGYLNASLVKTNGRTYELDRRCRFEFSKLVVSEGVDKKLTQNNTGYYTNDRLESSINEIINVYERDGYLFTKAEIDSLSTNIEDCTVSAHVSLEIGKKWITKGIKFVGADKNNSTYLTRISGYRDSLLITPTLLTELKTNLIQSELFLNVGLPEVFIEQSEAILLVPVEERILNQFDGLIGYVPDQNGNGQIVGDFDLSLWNVLNQGNGFNLSYQRLRPETSRLNVGVSQDWIGNTPIGLGMDFSLYQNDTTYQTRNLTLEGYYRLSRGLRLTGKVGSLVSTSTENTSAIVEPEGKKRYSELGFRFSTLDNLDVPTRGMLISTSFGISNKDVEIDSIRAFKQQYLYSNASFYSSVSDKSVLAFQVQGYFLNANQITESDLILFGGANSFRGYSEEQFRASELIWGDIEYRFMVNKSSYLFGFGSIGSYHRPRLLTETDDFFKKTSMLYSTGFGISYKIRTGRLKFTYAISPEESLGNGKVHIGFITAL